MQLSPTEARSCMRKLTQQNRLSQRHSITFNKPRVLVGMPMWARSVSFITQ